MMGLEKGGPMSVSARSVMSTDDVATRIKQLDWERISRELDDRGNAVLEHILTPVECRDLSDLYRKNKDDVFRSEVVMARHAVSLADFDSG